MRLGVWLLLPLSFSGCSGGYPLEPTLCDEICHVTKGPGCPGSYEPAACVVTCERTMANSEPCRPLVELMLSCFRTVPDAVEKRCDYLTPWEERPCEAEVQAMGVCLSSQGY